MAQIFAKIYSNLAESLLKNLPNSPNKFDIDSVHQYYKNIELKDKSKFDNGKEGFRNFSIH